MLKHQRRVLMAGIEGIEKPIEAAAVFGIAAAAAMTSATGAGTTLQDETV